MGILRMGLAFLRVFFASRAALAAENVMPRQQLIVVHRSVPRQGVSGRIASLLHEGGFQSLSRRNRSAPCARFCQFPFGLWAVAGLG
jgi:hypothetical protein